MKEYCMAKLRLNEKSVQYKSLPRLLLLTLVSVLGILSGMTNQVSASQNSKAIVQSVVISGNCEDGSQFISKMCSAAEALDNYQANYQQLVYKQHPPVLESGVFAFRKPKLMRVE